MPELPYSTEALAPKMSKETFEYHYGKHLQTYVDNLNRLIPGTPYESMSLQEIVKKADGPIFNNAAQAWNHTFFFLMLTPDQKPMPQKLADRIARDFGSVEAFKEEFSKAATGLFGSGWTWLAADKDGKLQIISESNAGNPMTKGLKPVMTIDVWETRLLYRLPQPPRGFHQIVLGADRLGQGGRPHIPPQNTTAPPATTYMIRPRAIPKAASHPARHSKTSRTTGYAPFADSTRIPSRSWKRNRRSGKLKKAAHKRCFFVSGESVADTRQPFFRAPRERKAGPAQFRPTPEIRDRPANRSTSLFQSILISTLLRLKPLSARHSSSAQTPHFGVCRTTVSKNISSGKQRATSLQVINPPKRCLAGLFRKLRSPQTHIIRTVRSSGRQRLVF